MSAMPRRRRSDKPTITIDQVVDWALTYFERTGGWPKPESGAVRGRRDLNWNMIDMALRDGYRGLPRSGSLPRFLDKYLSEARKATRRPKLSLAKIRQWAAAHHRRTGRWPTVAAAGDIPESPGDTWRSINKALTRGTRGLGAKSTLAKVLGKTPGSIRRLVGAPLTVKQILQWSREHHEEFGTWPTIGSGSPLSAPREKWVNINMALKNGQRGLPGGTTLSKLLKRETGSIRSLRLPPLTIQLVLDRADDYHRRHGKWPTEHSGPVDGLPGETWKKVQSAFHTGTRGLAPGSSLAKTLNRYRGVPCIQRSESPLTERQILKWADAYYAKHGRWPSGASGFVEGTDHEDWRKITGSLCDGTRGLPGGSSLSRLLAAKRGVPHQSEGLKPRIKRRGRYAGGMTRLKREARRQLRGRS